MDTLTVTTSADIGGILYINETENAEMTFGLTINQADNDDEILAFKSSDVDHGMTILNETDTFAAFYKNAGAAGGLRIRAIRDADGSARAALSLQAILCENVDTTMSNAGRAISENVNYQNSGTDFGDVVADGNIFAIRGRVSGASITQWICDIDGDTWQSGSIQATHAALGTTVPDGDYGLAITKAFAGTSTDTYACMYNSLTTTHTETANFYDIGTFQTLYSYNASGSDNTGYSVGGMFNNFHRGSGDLDDQRGISTQYGLYTGGTGTVTEAAGLRIFPYSYAAGTITNMASIWINARTDDGATVTNEWAIYSAHAAPSYLVNTLNIGDTTINANMVRGITINQGGNDDEILAFKSSDVDHGITSFAETDTFGFMQKGAPTTGGVDFRALSSGNYAMTIRGVVETADTTKGAGAVAPLILDGGMRSGTTWDVMTANANVLVVRSAATAKWILDAEGDTWQSGRMATLGTDTTKVCTYSAAQQWVHRDVAEYKWVTPPNSATLQLTMPKEWSDSMIVMVFRGFSMYNGGPFEIRISGMNASAGPNWNYDEIYFVGRCAFNVRFAHDTVLEKCCILFGDMDYDWSYTWIRLAEVFVGYVNYGEWETGWEFTMLTDEDDIDEIQTPPTNFREIVSGGISMPMLKVGATQGAAGAAAGELWRTSGHATQEDNTVMVGV
jgi:hypothetical protein